MDVFGPMHNPYHQKFKAGASTTNGNNAQNSLSVLKSSRNQTKVTNTRTNSFTRLSYVPPKDAIKPKADMKGSYVAPNNPRSSKNRTVKTFNNHFKHATAKIPISIHTGRAIKYNAMPVPSSDPRSPVNGNRGVNATYSGSSNTGSHYHVSKKAVKIKDHKSGCGCGS